MHEDCAVPEHVDEDAFFIARRPVRPEDASEQAASSSSPPPAGEESPPHKRPRPLTEALSPPTPSAPDAPSAPDTPAPAPSRARSVSITPPPELDEDMREFARQAVENVMRRNGTNIRHEDDDLAAPTSDDGALDLNADLARYYKGPNAHRLRERAIAREREQQSQRQRRAEEAEVVEALHSASPPKNVITIDDSSDEEPAEPAPMSAHAEPEPAIPEDANTLSLVLRAARGEPVPVKVRPTTKMATILSHFVQSATLSADEQSRAYLSFEGEVRVPLTQRLQLSSCVQDNELEDDDQLEVMW